MVVDNSAQLADSLNRLLSSKDYSQLNGNSARALVEGNIGVIDKILDGIVAL
jgi:hypothetical protein